MTSLGAKSQRHLLRQWPPQTGIERIGVWTHYLIPNGMGLVHGGRRGLGIARGETRRAATWNWSTDKYPSQDFGALSGLGCSVWARPQKVFGAS